MIPWPLMLTTAALAQATPMSLTVARAVDLAVERNPDLRSAELALAIADIDARRARLDRFTATVSGSADLWDTLTRPWDGEATDESTSTWDLRASAGVTLYAGGAVDAAIDGARAQARVAELDLEIGRRDLVRAAYTACWNLKGMDLQIAAAQEGLLVTRQALDIIRSKADAGLAAGIDVNRSTVDLLSQQDTLMALEAARDQAEQELLRLLQYPTEGPVVVAQDPPLPRTDPVEPPSLDRPEEDRARATVDVAEAGVRAARAGALPTVSLWGEAGYGTALSPTVPALDGGLAQPGLDASVGLGLAWSPFDLWSTRDATQQAELVRSQARAALEGEEARLTAQVRNAASEVSQLRQRAPLVAEQVRLARDNLQIVQDLYAQGSASILDLFNAQTAFRQARSQEAGFAVDLAIAEYDLQWAAGLVPGETP